MNSVKELLTQLENIKSHITVEEYNNLITLAYKVESENYSAGIRDGYSDGYLEENKIIDLKEPR